MVKNNSLNKKEKLVGFDLSRVLCAIGIICFHFSCHSSENAVKILYNFNSGSWGDVFVIMFFIISGCVLSYNYSGKYSLKIYYYKRWKAIFPMFYIGYFYFFIRRVIASGSLFWGPSKIKLILTIFGLDGIANLYGVSSYYLIGEWFLGAIIILYFLFPLLNYLFNIFKYSWIVFGVVLIILYILSVKNNFFEGFGFVGQPTQNLIANILCFYLGFILSKFRVQLLEKKIALFLSIVIVITLLFSNFGIPFFITEPIFAFALLIVTYILGIKISNIHLFNKLVKNLSNLTYPVFLLQHMIILNVLNAFYPEDTIMIIILLILITFLIFIFSKVLDIVISYVLNTNIYVWLENKLFSRIKK